MEEVKLFGAWPSPISYKVVWALKLKGVGYDFVNEDLSNKSAMLLQYNPVHKKIPVLIHKGKPIVESTIILEYIEEVWPWNPLLPSDRYERASARFWAKFADEKGLVIWKVFWTTGEEQEEAIKESLEMLRTIEEHGLGEKKFFGGDQIGLVDLAFGGLAHWLAVIEDTVGMKFVEPHVFPRLNAWINNFKEVPVIKENLPDPDELLVFFRGLREKILSRLPSA